MKVVLFTPCLWTSGCGRRSSPRSPSTRSRRRTSTASVEARSTSGPRSSSGASRATWPSSARRSGGYVALAMARRLLSGSRLMLVGSRAADDPPERKAAREDALALLDEGGLEAWAPNAPEAAARRADRGRGQAGDRRPPGSPRPLGRCAELRRPALGRRRRRRPVHAARRGSRDRRAGEERPTRGSKAWATSRASISRSASTQPCEFLEEAASPAGLVLDAKRRHPTA